MPTLLVMAAGMGSRYGGLKQIDPIGPGGETLADYSLYDALNAGFVKIVFIIRRDFEAAFRQAVDAKLQGRAEIAYVFQGLDSCTGGFVPPPDRVKPWGTGHAILTACTAVAEPFAVINADDYYGRESFRIVADYLRGESARDGDEYAMVGFTLRNTLSEHGHVSRGVCEIDGGGFLKKVVEREKIVREGRGARCQAEGGAELDLSGDEIASMNLWAFNPSIFQRLQTRFDRFLAERGGDPKAEYYIPTVVDD